MGLKEHGAHAIVKCAENALGSAILRRRVRTREPQENAVLSKEGAHGSVVELTSIIGLNRQNRTLELSGYVSVKITESLVNIGFAFQRKSPCVMREIIKYNQIILIFRDA